MARRVLHVLSQRPLRTGSGITLDALVRRAAAVGWEQRVVCAAPRDEPAPDVGGLAPEHVRPLLFETDALPFAIPGMSDVMPYPSRRFSSLSPDELDRYRRAWSAHIAAARDDFAPDVIHVHHLWLVAAITRALGDDYVVAHGHGTGLRQMQLCPELGAEVRAGCAGIDRVLVLHDEHRAHYHAALGGAAERIAVVGAGYRDDVFTPAAAADRDPQAVVFAGKLAAAKGLPWLLDAVDRLAADRPIRLHVAGGGAGDEADALRARMAASPHVTLHGMLSQHQLAALLGRSAVFALPSMYEGLPLSLIEALACGARAVATDLPGVRALGSLGGALTRVAPPARTDVDRPVAAELPGFVDRLSDALAAALDAGPVAAATLGDHLRRFTWDAVFDRVEPIWLRRPPADAAC